jgi:hypothetical protein
MLPCSPKPSIEPMTLSRLDALDGHHARPIIIFQRWGCCAEFFG